MCFTIENSLNSKQRGFTIIELMIAVLILGVFVTLAAPSFSDFIERQRIKTAVDDVSRVFAAARVEATSSGSAKVCWNDEPLDSVTTITKDGVDIFPGKLVVMIDESLPAFTVLNEISYLEDGLSTIDNDGDNCITFTSQGRMNGSTNPDLEFLYCREAGDATDAKRVEISPSGRASVKEGVGTQAC